MKQIKTLSIVGQMMLLNDSLRLALAQLENKSVTDDDLRAAIEQLERIKKESGKVKRTWNRDLDGCRKHFMQGIRECIRWLEYVRKHGDDERAQELQIRSARTIQKATESLRKAIL